jgi:hypothetical protein
MTKIHLQDISLGIIPITIIIAASVVSTIAVTEYASFGIAYSQVSNRTLSSSLTPQQKAAMCNPSNPKLNFINTTESKICGIPPTSTNTTMPTNITAPTTGKQSPPSSLYKQGYAKGIADSKSVQVTFPPIGAIMSPDDVDCDSDIDPLANNQDYCSGYQHGYAGTFNNALRTK